MGGDLGGGELPQLLKRKILRKIKSEGRLEWLHDQHMEEAEKAERKLAVAEEESARQD